MDKEGINKFSRDKDNENEDNGDKDYKIAKKTKISKKKIRKKNENSKAFYAAISPISYKIGQIVNINSGGLTNLSGINSQTLTNSGQTTSSNQTKNSSQTANSDQTTSSSQTKNSSQTANSDQTTSSSQTANLGALGNSGGLVFKYIDKEDYYTSIQEKSIFLGNYGYYFGDIPAIKNMSFLKKISIITIEEGDLTNISQNDLMKIRQMNMELATLTFRQIFALDKFIRENISKRRFSSMHLRVESQ